MKLRIGTRGSQLALWQAESVQKSLRARHPDLECEIVVVESEGDRKKNQDIAELGSIGVFTREIEEALLAERVDVAVHSLKDLPTETCEGLQIGALLPRDDRRDTLISPRLAGTDAEDSRMAIAMLPRSAVVGTSSLRRQAELLRRRPDLQVVPVRGNVPTRLQKMEDGQLEAIVLSWAGLQRLGLFPPGCVLMHTDDMLPAPAQGTIAVQTRLDDPEATARAAAIDHLPTRITTGAERLAMRLLEGGCRIPLGASATIEESRLTLHVRILKSDGSEMLEHSDTAAVDEADALARRVAENLRGRGAERLLQRP